MGLFDFVNSSFRQTVALQDIAARYRRIGPVRFRLNHVLSNQLPRDVLDDGARSLGMLRGKAFVIGDESELAVLMDYCIHDVYRHGRNAVEQYLVDSPPDPVSDEMTCLTAMQRATYALVVVIGVEQGVGCHIRNLFANETRMLADVGFSKTAERGALLATRLLDFGDFVTTSGAPLPVAVLDDKALDKWQRKLSAGANCDHFDPAPLIRACLERGASSVIEYAPPDAVARTDIGAEFSPGSVTARGRREPAKRIAGNAGQNRRCRCGSGKMFKNCCGKRQATLRESR